MKLRLLVPDVPFMKTVSDMDEIRRTFRLSTVVYLAKPAGDPRYNIVNALIGQRCLMKNRQMYPSVKNENCVKDKPFTPDIMASAHFRQDVASKTLTQPFAKARSEIARRAIKKCAVLTVFPPQKTLLMTIGQLDESRRGGSRLKTQFCN